MATINLEGLQPGMVLLEDAVHFNGRVLLGAGMTLSEKHIMLFKTWGLSEANIEGLGKEDITSQSVALIDPEQLKNIEQELNKLFMHTDQTHPAIAELFRLRMRNIIEQESKE